MVQLEKYANARAQAGDFTPLPPLRSDRQPSPSISSMPPGSWLSVSVTNIA